MASELTNLLSPVESHAGPWHTNTVVEYAKNSVYLQDMTTSTFSKVLVIYCGGTVGMKHDHLNGYYPVPGYLADYLQQSDTFNDRDSLRGSFSGESEFDISLMPKTAGRVLILPPSIYGKRTAYQILEYEPLKDSCNMSMADWIQIATDIETFYYEYDAFVILHGTDTMAYTVSALSFLLENLGKTVVFTGSQIPFSELRNDAKDNLLGALTIASHYVIPEVCLFFGNKLYRGNRVSKINAVDFNAFESPNLKPLARLGVNIEIEWSEILRSTEIAPFRAHKSLDPNVGCLRFFPGITENSVRAFLSEPIKGVVLETFGTGNAPDNRPEIIRAISEAIARGVVIVNITQCSKGAVTEAYSTGHALIAAGVVSGRDMTAECALTKLSYLLGCPKYNVEMVRHLVSESMRGELTVPIVHRKNGTHRPSSWLASVFNSAVLSTAAGHRDAVDRLLRPLLMHVAASQGDVDTLRELSKHNAHVDTMDYDNRTALHAAVSSGQVEAVKWLVRHGANVHIRDCRGCTALFDALDAYLRERSAVHFEIVGFLAQAGARLSSHSRRLTDELLSAVRGGNIEILGLFQKLGMKMLSTNTDGRNILHIAIIYRQFQVISWIHSLDLWDDLSKMTDITGRTPIDEAELMGLQLE
jgi:lysophospholipase